MVFKRYFAGEFDGCFTDHDLEEVTNMVSRLSRFDNDFLYDYTDLDGNTIYLETLPFSLLDAVERYKEAHI
jgi:hypothetical protein